MENREPIVSVVIPTLNRPRLLVRAVRSALAQTLHTIEVVVVVDGPDDLTIEALGAIEDSRVVIKTLPRNVGPAEVRNAGVEASRGRWVAFLDHDDEWLPGKLDIQLRIARQSTFQHPIISCRFIKRSETTDVLLPRRLPARGEPMSEYLFRRTRLFGGEGLVQSPRFLRPKSCCRKSRFKPSREGMTTSTGSSGPPFVTILPYSL